MYKKNVIFSLASFYHLQQGINIYKHKCMVMNNIICIFMNEKTLEKFALYFVYILARILHQYTCLRTRNTSKEKIYKLVVENHMHTMKKLK